MLSYSMILIFVRLQETTTYLTSGERLATPRWSSFCNSCAGVWIGRSASFERPISRDCDIDISAGFRLVQGAESWTICSELTKHTFHCFEPLCENTPQARQQGRELKKISSPCPSLSDYYYYLSLRSYDTYRDRTSSCRSL